MRGALDGKRKEICRHIDTRFDAQDARFDELDRTNDSRAYDITMHRMDVRERLATWKIAWA